MKLVLVKNELISFPMNVGKNLAHHLVLPLILFEMTIERKTYRANDGCLVFLAMRREDCGDPSGYVHHLQGQTL